MNRLLLLFALLLAPAAHAAESFGIAMHGAPRYADGRGPLSYVNPDAPQGGTLKLGAIGTFDSLHPFIVRGTPPQGLATGSFSLVYESLMMRSWDEPFSLYGLIAEKIDVPEDRHAITFTLREAARFHDGTPIRADDVLFSYETLKAKGRPNHRTYYKKVERAELLNDRTVRFTFKPDEHGVIDREMPLIMGLMPILPRHIWKDRNFDATTLALPVGSGPYRVEKIDAGRSITYVRDLAYWGRDLPLLKGLYNFERVQIDYFRDDGIALQAFKAGAFDLRRETSPVKWATAYGSPALTEGRLKKEAFAHSRPEAAHGFVLNTRRAPLDNPALRAAAQTAFDSGWINRALFHGLYKRTESFFPNSELAHNASSLPLAGRVGVGVLDDRDEIGKNKASVTNPHPNPPRKGEGEKEFPSWENIAPPSTDGTPESLRANLLKGAAILKEAGYALRDEKLFSPQGKRVTFEILLSDPAEEKIALNWARNLKRLGIDARTRTVDSAQYQARLAAFDYDVTVVKWHNSLSPGNEQSFFWGSAASGQQGSRNYGGIKNKDIDALAAAIPAARTREDLLTTTQALDRALLVQNFFVPFFHLGYDPIAFWTQRLSHPEKTPLYGAVLESWWHR